MLTNYHTHTTRCGHAEGTEEEYILTALRCGFKVLGFSDHTPWAYATPGFVSRIRMLPSQLDDYVLTLRGLREKYADKLHIRIGLEAEYFPAYLGWLKEEMERLDIEYLILGCHYDTTDEQDARASRFGGSTSTAHGRRYAEQVVEALETGLYRYLAHPDLFLNRVTAFDADAEKACRDICAAAARLDIPLEYNMAGLTLQDRPDGSLGYTLLMPEEDKTELRTRDELMAKIMVSMGGRAAEEVVMNTMTNGASQDIQDATNVARNMVAMFGMSDEFGMMALASRRNQYLDGGYGMDCAQDTAARMDQAVKDILDQCYQQAVEVIKASREDMDKVVAYLLEKETITGEEFMEILNREPAQAQ